MQTDGPGERWPRDFAGRRFTSHLTPAAPGRVHERFGPFTFLIELTESPGGFGMDIRGGRFLGLPLPRVCLPRSDTAEGIEDGRFTFDVRLSLPLAGPLVHYRGQLTRDGDPSPAPLQGAHPRPP